MVEAVALERRDADHAGPAQEVEFTLEVQIEPLAFIAVEQIPFIDRHHKRAPCFEHVASDVGIAFTHAFLGVNDKNDNVGVLNGLQCFNDGKLLHGLKNTAFLAQTSRIHQLVGTSVIFEIDLDRIARCARHIKGNDALFADQCIDGVFFMRNNLSELVQRALTGFAAGVMVAASIWSLLLPAMEQASDMERWSFVPAVAGFWLGILFLLGLDRLIPHLHRGSSEAEGVKSGLGKTTMLTLAVALHNIPEGMAVGAVYAGWLYGDSGITLAGALALSLGIAIQNFPEGAIISMPLKAEGLSNPCSFLYGTLSGAVEPVGAILTILLAGILVPVLPYALSFAAGAMIYVVVEELIPEMSAGRHSNVGTILFAVGFTLMMVLDVALG